MKEEITKEKEKIKQLQDTIKKLQEEVEEQEKLLIELLGPEDDDEIENANDNTKTNLTNITEEK